MKELPMFFPFGRRGRKRRFPLPGLERRPAGCRSLALEALEDRTLLSFIAATNFNTGASPDAVAVGDFNSDGQPDLVSVGSSEKTVSVLLGNGDGSFQQPRLTNLESIPY